MTIGYRISVIRKDNNLSQEAFGTALGVSRQSISKWESDQSIPDVEKLITIGNIYGVSIGWILGTENEKTQKSGELSEDQMRTVMGFVQHYIEAMQKHHPSTEQNDVKRKRSWRTVLSAIIIISLIIWFGTTLQDLQSQQNNLQNNINNVERSLNSRILGITSSIEKIIKAQDSLLSDFSAEVVSTDLRLGTASFALTAIPKTYSQGMTLDFTVNNGLRSISLAGSEGDGHKFSATLTCSITDSISLYAVLNTNGEAHTQLLEEFNGFLQKTYVSPAREDYSGRLWSEKPEDLLKRSRLVTYVYFSKDQKSNGISAESLNIRVYVNNKKVADAAGVPGSENNDPSIKDFYGFRFDIPLDFARDLKDGDEVIFAVVCTDNYGRSYCVSSSSYKLTGGRLEFNKARYVWDTKLGVE